MLLANMAKDESVKRILTIERAMPKELSTSKNAMDQLMTISHTSSRIWQKYMQ